MSSDDDISNNCNCGWGGANCDVALVNQPLNYKCDLNHGYCASVQEQGYTIAQCSCDCSTWGGNDCSQYMVIPASAGVCIALSVIVIIVLITWMSIRDIPYYRSLAFTKEYLRVNEWNRVKGIASYHPNDKLPQWLKVVFCYRIIAFTFTLGVLVSQISLEGWEALQYFTVWNFCILILYFGLGVLVTYKGIVAEMEEEEHYKRLKQTIKEYKKNYPNFKLNDNEKYIPVKDRPMNLLQRAHFAVLQIELPCTLLIALVVWAVLYPASGSALLNFYSYIEHAANFFFILFDFMFFTQYALVSWHNFLIQLWLAIYGLFQMIFITSGGCPAYFFLSLSSPFTVFWLLALLAVGIIFFFFFAGVSWHCGCCLGKRYLTCDAEDELDIPTNKAIDAVFCISCQKDSCSCCGPVRYRAENAITKLSTLEDVTDEEQLQQQELPQQALDENIEVVKIDQEQPQQEKLDIDGNQNVPESTLVVS